MLFVFIVAVDIEVFISLSDLMSELMNFCKCKENNCLFSYLAFVY